MYLSRVAAMSAGIGHTTPAFNVNRLCGSGLQAIISAAQALKLGDARIAIGAGAESMSRAPYISVGQRWGARMGDSRSEEHTSELQSLMRISNAVFCLKKQN